MKFSYMNRAGARRVLAPLFLFCALLSAAAGHAKAIKFNWYIDNFDSTPKLIETAGFKPNPAAGAEENFVAGITFLLTKMPPTVVILRGGRGNALNKQALTSDFTPTTASALFFKAVSEANIPIYFTHTLACTKPALIQQAKNVSSDNKLGASPIDEQASLAQALLNAELVPASQGGQPVRAAGLVVQVNEYFAGPGSVDPTANNACYANYLQEGQLVKSSKALSPELCTDGTLGEVATYMGSLKNYFAAANNSQRQFAFSVELSSTDVCSGGHINDFLYGQVLKYKGTVMPRFFWTYQHPEKLEIYAKEFLARWQGTGVGLQPIVQTEAGRRRAPDPKVAGALAMNTAMGYWGTVLGEMDISVAVYPLEAVTGDDVDVIVKNAVDLKPVPTPAKLLPTSTPTPILSK